MYHEQLVKHNNLNTKMNLHNDDDNVNDGDIHDIIIMTVLGSTHMCSYSPSVADTRGRDKDDNSSVRLDHLLTTEAHASPTLFGCPGACT